MTLVTPPPILVLIAGLDPSGGAGILADTAVCTVRGCLPAGVVTTTTDQDRNQLYASHPLPSNVIGAQLERLLSTTEVAGVKIGALGSPGNAIAIAQALGALSVPIVWDPVIEASTGQGLNGLGTLEAACEYLLPKVSVLTPNRAESLAILKAVGISKLADLLDRGPSAVVVTGADDIKSAEHQPASNLEIRIYSRSGESCISGTHVPGQFRGTGCTFSTALAIELSKGQPLNSAVQRAHDFTRRCLERTQPPAQGPAIPDRTAP